MQTLITDSFFLNAIEESISKVKKLSCEMTISHFIFKIMSHSQPSEVIHSNRYHGSKSDKLVALFL